MIRSANSMWLVRAEQLTATLGQSFPEVYARHAARASESAFGSLANLTTYRPERDSKQSTLFSLSS